MEPKQNKFMAKGAKRHVWFVNHYAGTPHNGRPARHFELAKRLPGHGWTASIVSAETAPGRGLLKLFALRQREMYRAQGVEIRSLGTTPEEGSLLLRATSWLVFTANLLAPGGTRDLTRPDVVVGSTVHPLAAWAGWRLARRYHAPFVFEVRDVWPETLVDMGALKKEGVADRLMKRFVGKLTERAELVLSPLPFVGQHLRETGRSDTPFLHISNGADVPEEVPSFRDRENKSFTFMYLGAHGAANCLEHIVEAFETAHALQPDLDMRLRFVGSGPRKDSVRARAATGTCADRISFEKRVPNSQVAPIAAEADCLVATTADLRVYRFGTSLNKLALYLSSGRPIIFASSAPNNPVQESQAGYAPPSGDVGAFAEAMVNMAMLPESQREIMARRGYQYARESFSFENLAQSLAAGLDRILGKALAK